MNFHGVSSTHSQRWSSWWLIFGIRGTISWHSWQGNIRKTRGKCVLSVASFFVHCFFFSLCSSSYFLFWCDVVVAQYLLICLFSCFFLLFFITAIMFWLRLGQIFILFHCSLTKTTPINDEKQYLNCNYTNTQTTLIMFGLCAVVSILLLC